MRHGTCFRRRLATRHAGAAPHSAVAELEVVRRRYALPMNLSAGAILFSIFLRAALAFGAEPVREYQAQDGWRMLQTALPHALKSNREAVHDCFMAAYLRASSPFLGGEDCEAIHSGLSEILYRLGDRAYSQALAVERPEVIAAVKFWIRRSPGFYRQRGFKSFDIAGYPKTMKLLDSVSDADFPLREESPRRAPLLKQLSP